MPETRTTPASTSRTNPGLSRYLNASNATAVQITKATSNTIAKWETNPNSARQNQTQDLTPYPLRRDTKQAHKRGRPSADNQYKFWVMIYAKPAASNTSEPTIRNPLRPFHIAINFHAPQTAINRYNTDSTAYAWIEKKPANTRRLKFNGE